MVAVKAVHFLMYLMCINYDNFYIFKGRERIMSTLNFKRKGGDACARGLACSTPFLFIV